MGNAIGHQTNALAINDNVNGLRSGGARHDDDGWVYQNSGDPPDSPVDEAGWTSYTEDDATGERVLHAYGIWNQFPRPTLVLEAPVAGNYSFDGMVKIDWGWDPGADPHHNDFPIGPSFYG